MKFYGRTAELEALKVISEQDGARMVVVTGRRRIGKTSLSFEFVKKRRHLYLFVSKKSEPLLCQEYIRQIKDAFDVPVIGEMTRFADVFKLLLEIAKQEPYVLIIDEFQEFLNINPSVFSDVQNLWDQYKNETQITALFMGSVYSLMNRIFQEASEPLFGRADRILHLRPFPIGTVYDILRDYGQADLSLLFDYYLFTGASPKYVDTLVSNKLFSREQLISFIASDSSPFLQEGKYVLIEEFGKDYATYFSILELIAAGKTSRTEIESVLQRDVGGYLDRLDKDYAVLRKYKPINAKPESKLMKYQIADHFLRFWFRFIYRHRSAVEMGNYKYIQDAIHRNISAYSGPVLEQFFHELLAASQSFNKIGYYWERGHKNEIDLVGINDVEKHLVIAEVKRNKDRISLEKLREKSSRLVKDYSRYQVDYLALSLEDAKEYLT